MKLTSHCPYCTTDTTDVAYVHPELGLRYCSKQHASDHVGVATHYQLTSGGVVPEEHMPDHERGWAVPAARPA